MQAFIYTFIIGMIPILELRGAIPFGVASGLTIPEAYITAVIGNILPLPFVILFIRKVFRFIKRHIPKLNSLVDRVENKIHKNGDKIKISKFRKFGLFIFVAIPLPGTGGWTGAMIAAFLDMRLKDAIFPLFLGVATAGMIMVSITHGASVLLF